MANKSGLKNPTPGREKCVIFVLSLGCPRNLVDSEVLTGLLKKKGYGVTFDPEKADVAIVNTCAFIEDAREEGVDILLELEELKKKGKIKRLVVTGCLSQRYPEELAGEFKEIDAVFGSDNFHEIPGLMPGILRGEKIRRVSGIPRFLYSHDMPRSFMTPRHFAYVKIQEGCRNFCSFCVIPAIRGPFRSRDMDSVLKEIKALRKRGVKEINLIGQDTTLYGADRYGKPALAELLSGAASIMKSGWVRLLYTHPAHYTERLIEVIAEAPAVCKYVDLPVQHINDGILRRMRRRVTKKDIMGLIEKLRRNIPGLAIRTTVMVGFPGEGEKEFRELENFMREIKFERLGIFTYSREKSTSAFDFTGQVPEKEKERRMKHLMRLQRKISKEVNASYRDKTLRVLIDEKDKTERGFYLGRTQHDAPEVDGTVYVKSARPLGEGDFVDVKIEDVFDYDLTGSVRSRESARGDRTK